MTSHPYGAVLATACVLILSACGKPPDRVEITDTMKRSEHRPVNRVNATSSERFALALPQTAAPQAMPAQNDSLFEFVTPEGWTEVEPTQFRNPNFKIGPDGETECYVSVLGGGGGGLLVNANRWRQQMGREAFTDQEFAELPHADILDQEAVVVDFEGVFTGMGQSPKEGYRLIGALLEAPRAAIFIKMVGPTEALETQKDDFARFAQSLRMKDSPGEQTVASNAPEPEPQQTAASTPLTAGGGFTWEIPQGWTVVESASSMRLVTFTFGQGNTGECYVVVLGGTGGGRLNNMNRWLSQMTQPPLEPSELDLQPKISLLGEIVPMLIAKGDYSGMGGEIRPGQLLLGATAELEDKSVFIKLIAPETVGNANWDKFTAFCASIATE